MNFPKLLASLMSPIVVLFDHHVKNSKQFAQFATTHSLRDTEALVLFDVVSLFKRVSTTRAIEVSRERLLDDPSLSDCLSVEDICFLLRLCL